MFMMALKVCSATVGRPTP